MFHVKQYQDVFEKLYLVQEEYNSHTNITRIRSKEEYWVKHIQDSLFLNEHIGSATTIIDVGSGGGYPGLPLAITNPGVRVVLNDSIQKKTRYLNLAKATLALDNVEVITSRAETLGRDSAHRGCYDLAVARAVADTAVLLEYLSPLVKVGGRVLIMKAGEVGEELKRAFGAMQRLSVKKEEVVRYNIGENDRSLLVFTKQKETPLKYPREAGVPKQSPL